MEVRERVRQELKEAGWIVTSKDALKFGADFLLYHPPHPHSVAAVIVARPEELTYLEAQRFSRVCEAVNKKAIFAVSAENGIKYVRPDRWVIHLSYSLFVKSKY